MEEDFENNSQPFSKILIEFLFLNMSTIFLKKYPKRTIITIFPKFKFKKRKIIWILKIYF